MLVFVFNRRAFTFYSLESVGSFFALSPPLIPFKLLSAVEEKDVINEHCTIVNVLLGTSIGRVGYC